MKKKLKKIYLWLKPAIQTGAHTAVGTLASAVLIEEVDLHFVVSSSALAFIIAVLTKYADDSSSKEKERKN